MGISPAVAYTRLTILASVTFNFNSVLQIGERTVKIVEQGASIADATDFKVSQCFTHFLPERR